MQGKSVRGQNLELINCYLGESSEKTDKPFIVKTEPVEVDEFIVKKEDVPPYEKKYYGLLHRCEIIKQSNERLVNRIYYVKRLLRRRKKERKFLMERLDSYGDDYRSVAVSLFNEMIGGSSPPSTSQAPVVPMKVERNV